MNTVGNCFIGYILGFDIRTGIGEMSAYSYFNLDSIRSVKFGIDNSIVALHIGKLVKFTIDEKNTKNGLYWATDINEFVLNIDGPLLADFIKKVTDYSDRILPDNNPSLTNFFLSNNKPHRKYSNDLFLIKKVQELIDNFDKFSLRKAISGYEVSIKEGYHYKPGGDDSACIYIDANNLSTEYDPYISGYFPLYSKELAFDSNNGSYRKMLNQMWESLGGEIFKKKMEQELLFEKSNCIAKLKDHYNKDNHRMFLEEHIEILWNKFFSKIQQGFDCRIVLCKTDEFNTSIAIPPV